MPLANIKVIGGVFSDAEKQRLIEQVTEALIAVEGEGLRENTVVILEETRSGDWSVGGRLLTAHDVTALRAANGAPQRTEKGEG
jgi:4-oxalocrotonate tautomerase